MNNVVYPVQYLRALAALSVCYFHFIEVTTSRHDTTWLAFGGAGAAGVDLFFVISGFIMAMIVSNREISFSGFMRDRITRIAPLYWGATLLVFTIAAFWPHLLTTTKTDLLQLLHSLFFVPYGMSGGTADPTLVVGWTLNYEMFFYLTVALFVCFANDRNLLKTSVFIGGLVATGLLFRPENGYLKFYLDPIILEFPMGIFVYHCWKHTLGRTTAVTSGTLILVSLAFILLLTTDETQFSRSIYWGLPTAAMLYGSLHFLAYKNEFLKWLGDWSYSIYLLHVFIIIGFHKLIFPALVSFQFPWGLQLALITCAIVLISAISFHVLERPIDRWLKSILPVRASDARETKNAKTTA